MEVNKRLWHEPKTETIHLLDSTTVEAHIAGKSHEDTIGFVFVGGREIVVKCIDGEWNELDALAEIQFLMEREGL